MDGAVDGNHGLGVSAGEDPTGPAGHGVDLRTVEHGDADDVGAGGGVGRRAAGAGPERREAGHRVVTDVEDRELVPGPHGVPGHRGTHVPEPDVADPHVERTAGAPGPVATRPFPLTIAGS